ncbi:MAG: putative DNA modification/repair radical SAM protein [Deltaproteobacteria bacterium]|nr:MAG: putative DNA modification/repair radical SAM protein [Deltaproteobacteria bacterium]
MEETCSLLDKIDILAAAARYDASCASSGSARPRGAGLGSGRPAGVCHSWSADGRCISLLKLLFSNRCRYDCAYCVNRRSNDGRRASFTPREVAELTVAFYRRNYIEGLFLSSGVFATPDETMEALVETVRLLREEYRFHGYIHLKLIPGADPRLVERAGRLADRLSVNIELPTSASLHRLAPDKDREAVLAPMRTAGTLLEAAAGERRRSRHAPDFAPAGQSTQLIVGATPEPDREILTLSEALYRRMNLRRVYYSAYVPAVADNRLPALTGPPLLREHRLYQADWLLRFYGFSVEELFDAASPNLDERLDPKAAWAVRHPELFPVEINRADYEMLLRVPGIGVRSARRIVSARRAGPLHGDDLPRLGVVMKRARWFLTAAGRYLGERGEAAASHLLATAPAVSRTARQLPLFAGVPAAPPGEG